MQLINSSRKVESKEIQTAYYSSKCHKQSDVVHSSEYCRNNAYSSSFKFPNTPTAIYTLVNLGKLPPQIPPQKKVWKLDIYERINV